MRVGLISDTHGLLRPEALDALAGVRIQIMHDVKELSIASGTDRPQVVVAGHSHKPGAAEREGILFVNPGSAGPRRFKLPVTVGYLTIMNGSAEAELRNLL